jgi:hypothetical protein
VNFPNTFGIYVVTTSAKFTCRLPRHCIDSYRINRWPYIVDYSVDLRSSACARTDTSSGNKLFGGAREIDSLEGAPHARATTNRSGGRHDARSRPKPAASSVFAVSAPPAVACGSDNLRSSLWNERRPGASAQLPYGLAAKCVAGLLQRLKKIRQLAIYAMQSSGNKMSNKSNRPGSWVDCVKCERIP